jgi:glycosyltransferase involved in cell wall biosynthesis
VWELSGRFPHIDMPTAQSAETLLGSLADQSLVVIDGLALPAFEQCLNKHKDRLKIIGFIHHPLSIETGLTAKQRHALANLEAGLWPLLKGIICPSQTTARAVKAVGVKPEQIAVAPPGLHINLPPNSPIHRHSGHNALNADVRLLAVGSVIARKNYLFLVEALTTLKHLNWQLDCIGSLDRSPELVQKLKHLIHTSGLHHRVTLHGEVSHQDRDAAYAAADIFVLPSLHEGYGMVFAEAMAWGLPIIATSAGAAIETIDAKAGRLIPVNDKAALTHALEELMCQPQLRSAMAQAARAAASHLPNWQDASLYWFTAVERLAR